MLLDAGDHTRFRMSTRTSVEQENTISRWLRWAIEGVTLVMVVGSPWAFACSDPPYEFYLHVCVGIIAVLWGVRMAFQKRLQWYFSPVALCLIAIFAIGLYQLVPLPPGLLHAISPSSASLVEDLLPDRPEVLPFGLEVDASARPPNHTLSVYPAATRFALFRLLAVLVLFEAVRNVCANRKSLERLSLCAFSNAVLLSFVGILQFLSSPPDVIYWTFKVRQSIFGPFLCRNHFPFYVNIGLGLGVGLFFATMNRQETDRSSSNGKSRRRRQDEFDHSQQYEAGFPKSFLLGLGDWMHSLLSNPKALWIGAGLAVIVCADFLSLSRGGVVALSAAAFGCVVYKSVTISGRSLSAGLLVILVLAFGLINWLGWNLVEARLGSLMSKDALSNRIPMWWDGVMAFKDFPIFGTGYGTFEYVEPLHRTFADDYVMFFDHAHNDYLEAAVEGGVLRLCAALCAIGFVYVAGIRSLRRLRGDRSADLVLGALFGFTTIVVHSFGEFGLFTPAITVLAAIVVAQICASDVWSREISGRRRDSETARALPYQLRLAGLAPAAGVVVALVVAAMLVAEGHRADWQCRFRNAAEKLRDAGPDAGERRIALLNEAIRWGPESAWAHLELGEVYLNAYQGEVDKIDPFGNIQSLFSFTFPASGRGLSAIESISVLAVSEPIVLAQLENGIEREYLGPALRSFIQARNLCPLLARAQLRLVALAAKLAQGDEPSAYLERARMLAGYDPEFWFLAGAIALADKRPADCWPLWKHSLSIAPKHFGPILNQSRLMLKPEEILVKLLPDNPRLILESANTLLPQPKNEAEKKTRKEYFQRATELLRLESGDITAEGWAVRASISHESGNTTDAIIAMRRAMAMDPKYEDLRLEVAKALTEQGDLVQAMRETVAVLTRQPWNEQAKSLEKQLKEALARP
jgi:tetratricopeptide (TPR) repeat protein